MKKIVPDPPATPLEAGLSTDPLLDQAAADRALNHYLLKPPVPQLSKTSSLSSVTALAWNRLWSKLQDCCAARVLRQARLNRLIGGRLDQAKVQPLGNYVYAVLIINIQDS
ncbi:hypothetical protein ACJJU9_24705 [Pseudomonas helleri]|uniref:hypothetical protein n=1 Tax=Pseudomonas helleri TaxID=1608996 RepID=UPI00389B2064